MNDANKGLSISSAILKRTFDFLLSFIGLLLFGWIIIIAVVLASIDTGESGLFKQQRIGQFGKKFNMMKIRTMKSSANVNTTVTTSNDTRITDLGRLFRKFKIDELPQLINVFLGQMSFVGPRPDVPGFADQLQNHEKAILTLKPGITGPATLKYRNEETLLASVENSEQYNKDVIFPDKVRINLQYLNNYSFAKDIKYILATLFC